MSRVPITVRLTLVFAAAMATVLVATGLFVYLRLGAELDSALEESLRSRADDVAALVQRSGPALSRAGDRRLSEVEESFAQIVDARGAVVGGSPGVGARPLLAPPELAQAKQQPSVVARRTAPQLSEDPVSLLATPVEAPGERLLVVIVGTSLADRDEALNVLAAQLLIGGPIALLLTTLTAYALARAALRPVESMRRQAAAISAREPGRRLPLPPTHDELSRLGNTLNAMLARLEGALARERAFVADAGHELRTPLAIMKTELQLALRSSRSRSELQGAVRSAAEETDRLARMAEDLLVIASSEQRELPVLREPIEIGALFDKVLGRFANRAAERGSVLEAHAPAGLSVLADRSRLEQALGNMLDNALRHGGGRIRATAAERDGQLELHVLDEGPGFSADFLERAFERFSRADGARATRGTGLGLAVVEGIAVAHQGQAHAVNRAVGGADVWLSIPREVPAAQPAGELLSPPLTGSAIASGRRAEVPPRRAGSARAGAPRSGLRWVGVLAALVATTLVAAATLPLMSGSSSGTGAALVQVDAPDATDRAGQRDPGAGATQSAALPLAAAAETVPVRHRGDAADDAAIWVNPRAPGASTVIATDKQGGLAVYDLFGKELQYLAGGEMSGVDLRPGVPLGRRTITLVAASDRGDRTVALYRVDDRTRRLAQIGALESGTAVEGLCLHQSRASGTFSVFVDSDRGRVVQWQLITVAGRVSARRVRAFDVGEDVEGCVADDALGHLYIAEEERGIWKYGAEPSAGAKRELVDSTRAGGHLTADVQGLAIAHGPNGAGVLLASSQGSDTFTAYRREAGNAFVRTFRVGGARGIDDVEETDGIHVTTAALGSRFPNGLFVAQDGDNGNETQNFKLVPWRPLP